MKQPRSDPAGRSVLALLFVLLAGCSDGRPSQEVVGQDFAAQYPSVSVVSVKASEDEVAAASFRIAFQERATSRKGSYEVQYIEEAGAWRPTPPLPERLP
jgi:hypothetical protein